MAVVPENQGKTQLKMQRLTVNYTYMLRVLLVYYKHFEFKNYILREFPGSPVVKTWCFHCCGPGLDPWWVN